MSYLSVDTEAREVIESSLTLASASFFFILHLYIGLRYSRPNIHINTIDTLLNPLNHLFVADSLAFWNFPVNFYTGPPIYLIPIFQFLELSPSNMKLVLVGVMALTTAICFLIYTDVLGLKEGFVASLILISMNNWMVFRNADYTFMAFFSAILLFLYLQWQKKRKYSFYILGFLTGVMFYFKAVVAYIVASIAIGKIVSEPRDLIEELELRKLVVVLSLFLIGFSPWLIENFGILAPILLEALGIVSGGHASDLTLSNTLLSRLESLARLIHPMSLDYGSSGLNLNFFKYILPLGLAYSIYSEKFRFYGVTLLTMFVLNLHVPKYLRWQQLIVLMPIIPVVLVSVLEVKPGYKKVLIPLIALLLSVSFIPQVQLYENRLSSYQYEKEVFWKEPITVSDWKDYSRLNSSDEIMTNSPEIWMYGFYESHKTSVLLIPSDSEQISLQTKQAVLDNLNPDGVNDKKLVRNLTVVNSNNSAYRHNTTYILEKSPTCYHSEESCGYSATEIISSINSSSLERKTWRFKNKEFLVLN